jgi:hypothetical protein
MHRLWALIFKTFRRRRMRWFLERAKPRPDDVLLDVGGYPTNWSGLERPVRRIDVLNVHEIDWDPASSPALEIRTLEGDGRALDAADGAYDIVFSNSVIEHVGDWQAQRAFAREVSRVGRTLWVQTPARWFPVEPHYLTPFVHYLPRGWQKRLLRNASVWGWLARPSQEQVDATVDEIRLLDHREMRELFPDCEILRERVLGSTKSFIAFRPAARR